MAAVLWTLSALGADPTPTELVNDWQTLSGSTSPAKVVYWEAGAIRVLDLSTGAGTSVSIQSAARSTGELAVGPYPTWSPDGTRILYFTPSPYRRYIVMNADGSNLQEVSTGGPWTYGTCSWWGNDWVCVQESGGGNKKIVRIQIDASNNPGQKVNVVDFAPYGGSGREWISMSGDYVAWTDWGANPGGNRSVVRNWKTGAEMEVVPRAEDACSIVLKEDGSGAAAYCPNSHWDVEIRTFAPGIVPGGTLIGAWSVVDGGIMEMLQWSNDGNFICVMDSRQEKDVTQQRSWIRTADADGKPYMLLGWGMWGADLWVGTGGTANTPPVADAGPDQTVTEDDSVSLDGSGSSDADAGDTLTYSWTQTAGPSAALSSTTAASPTFIAPAVSSTTVLTFRLTVSDGKATVTDTVDITVNAVLDVTPPQLFINSVALEGELSDPTVSQVFVRGVPFGVIGTTWRTMDIAMVDGLNTLTVTAADDSGQSATRPVSVQVPTGTSTAPAGPTTLSATPKSDTELWLSWADNTTGEDGFRIYRDAGSGYQVIGTETENVVGYMDSTVVAGQTYSYYVVAYVGSVESPPSNGITVTAGTPSVNVLTPAAGASLNLGDMVSIAWTTTNVTDFDADIRLSLDGKATWTVIQPAWFPKGSPYLWKVGYKNTEADLTKPPIWEQVVTSNQINCILRVMDYQAQSIVGFSGTFTITVP